MKTKICVVCLSVALSFSNPTSAATSTFEFISITAQAVTEGLTLGGYTWLLQKGPRGFWSADNFFELKKQRALSELISPEDQQSDADVKQSTLFVIGGGGAGTFALETSRFAEFGVNTRSDAGRYDLATVSTSQVIALPLPATLPMYFGVCIGTLLIGRKRRRRLLRKTLRNVRRLHRQLLGGWIWFPSTLRVLPPQPSPRRRLASGPSGHE